VRIWLLRLFVENWQRKLISLLLAVVIWLVVSRSMTVTKSVANVPVRVTHLPSGKTIEGMHANGTLTKKLTLTLTGHREAIDELTSKDLEVVIDAAGKGEQWVEMIGKQHIKSLNPAIDASQMIDKISPLEVMVRQCKLVTDKVPVLVTQPIGEAPRGYQYLDVWPYHLSLTVTGPEEVVKKLKTRGLKLTFNLNDISRSELENLQASRKGSSDEVSYFVPNAWKKVVVSQLSDSPLEIDDPQAKALRIDFSRQDLLPIGSPIPVALFFPPKYSGTLNPETCEIALNPFVTKKNGIRMVAVPLYAQGVSRLFLDTVKDMLQIAVIAAPNEERSGLMWNVQFMYPHKLEDRYVSRVMAESNDELGDVHPQLREDYLRNRFRSYMNRFRLYTPDHKKLSLKIELEGSHISLKPLNLPPPQ
jgi:hypothetical protein